MFYMSFCFNVYKGLPVELWKIKNVNVYQVAEKFTI